MRCDVLVVGAGPGGATAAYWLARFGVDVLLVDKAHFPRTKPCGDGLAPGAEDMLRSMGLGDFLQTRGQPVRGIRLFLPGGRQSRLGSIGAGSDPGEQGWVLPRYVLDDELCRNAERAGARFLPGFTALSPRYEGSHSTGVLGHVGERPVSVESQLLILATGANRGLLRAFDLAGDILPSSLGLRLYAEHVAGPDDYLQVFIDDQLFPGYSWIFPTGDHSANVGSWVVLEGIDPRHGSQLLQAALRRMHDCEQLRESSQGKPVGFPLRSDFPAIPLYRDGLLVVGEAAGLVDPLTGEGIRLAMRSGWLAARVASYALDASDFTARPLQVYGDILNEWCAGYFQAARQLGAFLARPGMLTALVQRGQSDLRVREGLYCALLGKRPAEGLDLLRRAVI